MLYFRQWNRTQLRIRSCVYSRVCCFKIIIHYQGWDTVAISYFIPVFQNALSVHRKCLLDDCDYFNSINLCVFWQIKPIIQYKEAFSDNFTAFNGILEHSLHIFNAVNRMLRLFVGLRLRQAPPRWVTRKNKKMVKLLKCIIKIIINIWLWINLVRRCIHQMTLNTIWKPIKRVKFIYLTYKATQNNLKGNFWVSVHFWISLRVFFTIFFEHSNPSCIHCKPWAKKLIKNRKTSSNYIKS